VECGIKTSNLRQAGKPPMKRLGQQNFLRQMLGVERFELMQFRHQLRRDALRFAVFRSAMHHPMPHGGQLAAADSFPEPIHQHAHSRGVVGCNYRPGEVVGGVRTFHQERRCGQSNALNPAGENPPQ